MEHGDISNEVAPRLVFVFEGLIGYLAENTGDATKRNVLLRARAWKRAAAMWTLDQWTLKIMWDYTSRRRQSIDVVTYVDEREAERIRDRLDAHGYPFANFWATTLDEMLHLHVNNPAVVGVVDGDASRWLTYGSKGMSIGNL